MKKYKVIKYFGIEYEHATVLFVQKSQWEYLGEYNGFARMARHNIYVDVTKEQLKTFFKEMKEQKE